MWWNVLGAVAGAASGILGAKNANKPQGGSPQWQQNYQIALNNQARNMKQEVAPFSDDQLNAMQGIRDMQGMYAGDYDQLVQNAHGLTQGVTPEMVEQFRNPYINNVVDAVMNDIGVMRDREDIRTGNAAQGARAFGGDREAVARAVTGSEFARLGASTNANLRFGAEDRANALAFQQHGAMTAGNDALAAHLAGRTGYRLNDLNNLMGVGGMQQEYRQRQLNAPMDTIRFRSEINNAGSYSSPQRSGPYVDPIGMAISGAQGGARFANQAYNYGQGRGWWGASSPQGDPADMGPYSYTDPRR